MNSFEYKWEYHKSDSDEFYRWHIFFNGSCFAKAISEEAAREICDSHNRLWELEHNQ